MPQLSVVALVLASLHLEFWAGMPATRVLLAVDMKPRCITWERKVLSGKHVTCELQNAAAVFTRIIPELDMPHRCASYFRYLGRVVLPTWHELAAYFWQLCLLVAWLLVWAEAAVRSGQPLAKIQSAGASVCVKGLVS